MAESCISSPIKIRHLGPNRSDGLANLLQYIQRSSVGYPLVGLPPKVLVALDRCSKRQALTPFQRVATHNIDDHCPRRQRMDSIGLMGNRSLEHIRSAQNNRSIRRHWILQSIVYTNLG